MDYFGSPLMHRNRLIQKAAELRIPTERNFKTLQERIRVDHDKKSRSKLM